MQRFYIIVGVVSMIGLPVLFCRQIYYDLRYPNPAWWNQHWEDDPRIYMPLLACGVLVAAFVLWRDARRFKRTQQKHAQLWAILHMVRQKQAEGNWGEAMQWLKKYEKLYEE